MSDFKKRCIRYIKRVGGGSMLISIIVHIIIIIAATIWVVSSVQPPRKTQFKGGDNAPAAQHSVKMSNTQPHLDTLTKRLSVDTPNSTVSLPDLPTTPDSGPLNATLTSGLGTGGPTGGLKGPIMPLFGFKDVQPGATLVGRFYDLKQFRDHKPNPDLVKLGPARLAATEVADFIKGGWNSSSLSKFFQAPTTLYATQIFVPVIDALEAPKDYGVEKEVKPMAWIAHYKGRVSPPVTGAYRFVGTGDDLLAVRIDGRLVLDGGGAKGSDFKTDRPQSPAYAYDFNRNDWLIKTRGGFTVGHRMEVRAGQFYDIDIVISEGPGSGFCAMLLFEQEGVTYEKDRKGNPILPIFRVVNSKTEPSANAPRFMSDGPVWRALSASNR